MKEKKGEKSFSEFIRQFKPKGDLKELKGTGFSKNWEKTSREIEKASEKSLEKIQEETE